MFGFNLNELAKRIIVSVIGIGLFMVFINIYSAQILCSLLLLILYSEVLIGCYDSNVAIWKRILVFSSLILYIFAGLLGYVFILVGNSNLISPLIISVFAVDISAFVFGKILKGPKLIPVISPNKTWSGAICATLIGASCFKYLLGNLIFEDYSWLRVFFYGMLFAISAQIGDLIVSLAKRVCNKKDFTNWLPGHGGLIDRADSIVAALIFICLLNIFCFGELF